MIHRRGDEMVRTAFWKAPVLGPVSLRKSNLDGDRQADRRVHGGPHLAVLCYSADHYPAWRNELGFELPYGGFGENFTIEGKTELDVCIGDVYRIGGASIQVSTPRGPCFKIGFRWNRPDLVKRVEATGRHGWYVRVLAEGPVEAGQEFTLQERPNPAWTVAHTANVYRNRSKDRTAALELAAVGELMPRVRQELRQPT